MTLINNPREASCLTTYLPKKPEPPKTVTTSIQLIPKRRLKIKESVFFVKSLKIYKLSKTNINNMWKNNQVEK